MRACLSLIIVAVALGGCGVETASTAATVGTLKKQEIEQGQQTMEQARQKIEAATQQMQQRAEQAGGDK